MFFSEARIASKIDHPNVVKIYGLGRSDNVYCLAQEYVFGENYTQILLESGRKNYPLTVGTILRLIAQVADGLDIAHKLCADDGSPLELVHRDISGHNVMISYSGHPKLMDFGIAKAMDRGFETQVGVVKGKFPYMSPEQTLGKKLDHRSDIFSLGILAWEALTGENLFMGHSPGTIMKAIREKPIPPPSSVATQLSPLLDSIVMRALRRDPSLRYQEARDFALAIDEVITSAGLLIDADVISMELASIYGDRIDEKRKALSRALEGDIDYEALAEMYGCLSILDCEIPTISSLDNEFDMMDFKVQSTRPKPLLRGVSVAAQSNPELNHYFQRVKSSAETEFSSPSHIELLEEQEALSKLELEPPSSPGIDISDLLDGWGEITLSKPKKPESIETVETDKFLKQQADSIGKKDSGRLRTRNDRPLTLEELEEATIPAEFNLLPLSDTARKVDPSAVVADVSVPPSVRRSIEEAKHVGEDSNPDSESTSTVFDEFTAGSLSDTKEPRTGLKKRHNLLVYCVLMFIVGALITFFLST